MKDIAIKFYSPFYYLKLKKKFWRISYWSTIEFSHDLEYLEHIYKKWQHLEK